MSPVGKCALCLRTGVPLLDSHILPKWTYRQARDPSRSNGAPDPIVFKGGAVIQTSQQIREYLLCESCEELIGLDEGYVSRVAFQNDETLGLEGQLQYSAFSPRGRNGRGTSARAADISNLDCLSIARFAASVFWRAHVATRPKIAGLHLSNTVARALRRFVIGERVLPRGICLTVTVLLDDVAATPMRSLHSTTTTTPSTADGTLNRYHQFIAAGLLFCLGIGAMSHPEICLACAVKPHALFEDWRRVRFAWEGVHRIVSGEKKGRLARLE